MSTQADQTTSNRSRLWSAIGCAVAGAAVFHFFGNANKGYIDTASLFYWWTFQWWNPDSETQHGWLILALSAWLVWRNLRERRREAGGGRREDRDPQASGLRNAERGSGNADWGAPQSAVRNPQLAAVAAMVGGLALHVIGFGVQQARLSIIALLVFAWGVLRLAGGTRWGRATAFPLGFMVFAIPLNVLDSLGFWLRLGVIDATATLAHGAGIGVLQSGTQLLAPDGRFQYDVAAACSGVRSLMALSALSLLTGYLSFRSWWRRGALFLLCFPLVYVGNVARITSIVFAADWWGQDWGVRMHDIMGYGVFVIVLGGVFGAAKLLEQFLPERGAEAGRDRAAGEPEGRKPGTVSRWFGRPVSTMVAVLVLSAAAMAFLSHLESMPPRGRVGVRLAADGLNPVALPMFLGNDWFGRSVEVTDVEREILPPDTGFSRRQYVPLTNPIQAVFLSIVLSGRDRTSIHRPELCLIGQGWTIEGTGSRHFSYPGDAGAGFDATLLQVRREIVTPRGTESVPQLVAYWFVGGDAVAATHWSRAALDAWNRLFHFRADRWAYVLLQTDARDGEDAAIARMQAILNDTLPIFQPPAGSGEADG